MGCDNSKNLVHPQPDAGNTNADSSKSGDKPNTTSALEVTKPTALTQGDVRPLWLTVDGWDAIADRSTNLFFGSETKCSLVLPRDWVHVNTQAGVDVFEADNAFRRARITIKTIGLTVANTLGHLDIAQAVRNQDPMSRSGDRAWQLQESVWDGHPAVAHISTCWDDAWNCTNQEQQYFVLLDGHLTVAIVNFSAPVDADVAVISVLNNAKGSLRFISDLNVTDSRDSQTVASDMEMALIAGRSLFHRDMKISFWKPAGWTVETYDNHRLRIFSPAHASHNQYRSTFSVLKGKPEASDTAYLDALAAQSVLQMKADYHAFEMLSEQRCLLGCGSACYIRHYRWTDRDSGESFTQSQCFVLAFGLPAVAAPAVLGASTNSTATGAQTKRKMKPALFLVNSATLTALAADILPIFDAMVHSLRILRL